MQIPMSSIKVPKRQRQEFKNIDKLAESIKHFGQIQPIVVTKHKRDGDFDLVVGERRLRACIMAGLDYINAEISTEVDPLLLKELELEENLQREDLSWQEQVAAKLELDELKRAKLGDAVQKAQNTGKWGVRDMAILLGENVRTVSEDLRLAKAMRKDSNLREKLGRLPKTAAFKKLKEIERQAQMKSLVDRGKVSLKVNFKQGNCLELIKTVENETVNLLLTDPPFGQTALDDKMGIGLNILSYKSSLAKDDNSTFEEVKALLKKFIPLVSPKMKPGAHFFIFICIEMYAPLREIMIDNDFTVVNAPLIWYKDTSTSPFFGYSFMDCYEMILYGHKNPRTRMFHKAMKSLITIKPVPSRIKMHPFEKPLPLLKTIIEQSTGIGDTVLDPFAGAGSTLQAAKLMNRQPIGFELDEGHYLDGLKKLIERK